MPSADDARRTGHAASPGTKNPKTWVAILDVVIAALLLAWIVRVARRPADPARTQAMIARMTPLATAPVLAIAGAGAVLANPGGFIPIALKGISQTDPSATEYAVQWIFFTITSLLPLALALVLLLVAPARTGRVLGRVRGWLERHAKTIALFLVGALAISLLRNGIAGLDN